MSITRTEFSFEKNYVQIPNRWLRDERLSRRARGLLAEMMTHKIGWTITIDALVKAGPEGRDAIRTAVGELVAVGYLVRQQSREGGKFAEVEYDLRDPDEERDSTADWKTDDGKTDDGESATKNTISLEHDLSEGITAGELVPLDDVAPAATFDDFWLVWPKRKDRANAEKAWAKAIRKLDPQAIVDAATAYIEHPHREELKYVPYGASWLNGERWTDDLPTAPEVAPAAQPQYRRKQSVQQAMDVTAALKRQAEEARAAQNAIEQYPDFGISMREI